MNILGNRATHLVFPQISFNKPFIAAGILKIKIKYYIIRH